MTARNTEKPALSTPSSSLVAVGSRLVIRCQNHPTYRGLTTPKRECDGCDAVRFMRGASVRLHVSGPKVSDPSYDATVRWGSA